MHSVKVNENCHFCVALKINTNKGRTKSLGVFGDSSMVRLFFEKKNINNPTLRTAAFTRNNFGIFNSSIHRVNKKKFAQHETVHDISGIRF